MQTRFRIAFLLIGVACGGAVHAATPVANDDAYVMQQGGVLTVGAPGVLGNDTDAHPGDTLTAVLASDVGNGMLTLNADGSFTYRPDPAFYGSDSFSYEADDGTSSELAVVSLTVNQDNPYGGGGGGGGGGYGSGALSPALLVLLALVALYPRGLKPSKRRAISP